ncbi:MAG: HupE/UreJ family protein, partial [Planktomarina sp.]|nr:HupE/UreJ family protein [Planktomarina sp.]
MSSAMVFTLIFGTALLAHELRPAVAKVEVSQTEVKIEILVAVETLLAGIDLTEIIDTDEAPEAATYDALRGLDDDELAENVWAEWPQLLTDFVLEGAEVLR